MKIEKGVDKTNTSKNLTIMFLFQFIPYHTTHTKSLICILKDALNKKNRK